MRERGLISDRSGDFIFYSACRPSGTLNLPSCYPKYTGSFSLKCWAAGPGTYHSQPSGADVEGEWTYTSILLASSWRGV